MTVQQVKQALQKAGWPEDVIDQAACIALHESGYDEWAVGDKDLAPDEGPSYGLFQIDVAYHPDFNLKVWYEPVYNAQYALGLWRANGNSFHGVWSTAGSCE